MTVVILAGLGLGVGVVGLFRYTRRRVPDLGLILAPVSTKSSARAQPTAHQESSRSWRVDHEIGSRLAEVVRRHHVVDRLEPQLAICRLSLGDLCARLVLSVVVGSMTPALIILFLRLEHMDTSPILAMTWTICGGASGSIATLSRFRSQVKRSYAQARRIVCSFIDLVNLGLAGGMGIEGALLSAAELGDSDLSQTLFGALCSARDAGRTPWSAVEAVGSDLGITELKEIATAAAIAGTEGARIRSTLSARVVSIRRHELAREEAAANSTSERLFLPGILLLLGFLIFVGFPAFARITAGI